MEVSKTLPRPATVSSSSAGTRALVAAAMCPPGRECVVGELVWTSDLCDDLPCQCEWGFNGAASDGIAMAAEVRRLPGIERTGVQRALIDVMGRHGDPEWIARARIDVLLDLARRHPEGTLFRLEHGRPVAFPPGSRVVDPHRIVAPGPGAER